MSDEKIRLRFSGLVIFVAQMASLITGLIFVTIIARSLSTTENGAWISIGQLVATATVAGGIFPFWSARYAARKFPGAMTLGLLSNIGLCIPVLIIALVVAPIFASAAQTSLLNVGYSGLLILESYILSALVPVVVVKRPQVTGYVLIVFEVLKIIAIVPLVIVLRLGVFGVMTAVAVANLAEILLYTFTLRGLWRQKPNFGYFSEWMKGSPLNVYGAGATIVGSLYVFLLLFASGPPPVAVYAAGLFGYALTIATPIGYTGSVTTALYPKLLAGGTSTDVEIVWRLSLMFSIPFTLAVILLSPSLLGILGPPFVPAWRAVIVLAISTLISTWGGIFDRVLLGTEKLDLEGTISVQAVLRSRLAKGVTVSYITNGVSLAFLGWLLSFMSGDAVTAVEWAAVAVLLAQVSFVAAKYLLARKSMSFNFPARSTLKYTAIGGVLLLVVPFLQQPMRASITIPLFAGGAGAYLLLLYFLDEEAKTIIRAIVGDLRGRLRFSNA